MKRAVELPIGDWQALPSNNFFPHKSSYHFRDLNCHQILDSNTTDLKPGSSTYFFLLFSFLVFTRCQVLNPRVGRSRDQVLQRAIFGLSRPFALPIALRAPCHSSSLFLLVLFLLRLETRLKWAEKFYWSNSSQSD